MDDGAWIEQLKPELLDENLPIPLYHQVYTILRDYITRGVIKGESVLPGEQDLCRMLGVSRITIKRALKDLNSEGLVTRHRGRGTIVVEGSTQPVVNASIDNLIESLHVTGYETAIELLEVTNVIPPPEVAEGLKVDPRTPVQRITRRRVFAGNPFSHLQTYVPGSLAELYSEADLAHTPMLALLQRSGYKVEGGEQWITAVGAKAEFAAHLGVSVGTPVLRFERILTGPDGPIQLLIAHYHPERYRFYMRTSAPAAAVKKHSPRTKK